MQVKSPAFADGSAIPQRYTRDGENLSPPLEWSGAPRDTRSFVVLVEDPDAPSGTFRHWAAYDLAPGQTSLAESEVPDHQAINDFGNRGYDGPQPPKGHGRHHYHIRVAALAVDHLDVKPKATVAEIWASAAPHVLAQAEMVGTYMRG